MKQTVKMHYLTKKNSTAVESVNYFILISADSHKNMLSLPSAFDLANSRLKNRMWGFNNRTKNKSIIKKNDRVVIYTSGSRDGGRIFIGYAKIQSVVHEPTLTEKQKVDSQYKAQNSLPTIILYLSNVNFLKSPKSIYSIKNKLACIKNPESSKWGAVLQGGSLKIGVKDFEIITA